jgi:hypothetical protein
MSSIIPTYEESFQAYDILQCQREDGSWVDFGTIRDVADAVYSAHLVELGSWERRPKNFRVVRNVVGQGKVVVLHNTVAE